MPPTPTTPTAGPGLSAATVVVGVIGDPVGRSLSPLLHNTAFAELGIDWVSVGFTVAPGAVAAALRGARALGINGLSAAALAGAVGCVGAAGDVAQCDLVVNATPLGMARGRSGGPGEWPLDPTLLGPGPLVVDLVYQPPLPPWLEAARARGASVANGVGMLVHQAALQLTLWTGLEAPVDAMWRAVPPT